MAVKVVDDGYIYGLIAGELDRLDDFPAGLVYEVAVNAVRDIRAGRSRWPVDTSFSQQNFFAEIDGSIWNNADYAKYVEGNTNAIHDYLRENIGNLIPEAAALALEEPLEQFTAAQTALFNQSRGVFRQARELTRLARTERRRRPRLEFFRQLEERDSLGEVSRESFRNNLRRRRFDDEDDFEALFH